MSVAKVKLYYLFDVDYGTTEWRAKANIIVRASSLDEAFSWIEARVLTCEPTADLECPDEKTLISRVSSVITFDQVYRYIATSTDLAPLEAKCPKAQEFWGVETSDIAA